MGKSHDSSHEHGIKMEEAVQTAVEELGYTILRVKQKEVILHYLKGKDVFISLPSGGGADLALLSN